jgi:hypothetical protein
MIYSILPFADTSAPARRSGAKSELKFNPARQQGGTEVVRKLIVGITFATAIAPTILAAAESRHPYLPPEEYDRPYTGELKIIRHDTVTEVQAACPTVPNPMACARVFSATKCEVHLLPDYMYVRDGPDIIMRHEIGHCNGWVHARTEGAPKPANEATASPPVNNPDQEEKRMTQIIATTYKRCLLERSSDGWKKTYSKEEIDNYCGCFSVLINERVPENEWREAIAAGTWGKHPVLAEVTSYCTSKYMSLPDVSAIRKKKW